MRGRDGLVVVLVELPKAGKRTHGDVERSARLSRDPQRLLDDRQGFGGDDHALPTGGGVHARHVGGWTPSRHQGLQPLHLCKRRRGRAFGDGFIGVQHVYAANRAHAPARVFEQLQPAARGLARLVLAGAHAFQHEASHDLVRLVEGGAGAGEPLRPQAGCDSQEQRGGLACTRESGGHQGKLARPRIYEDRVPKLPCYLRCDRGHMAR